MTATMTMELERPSIGEMAPRFSLPSLSGAEVNLTSYRGRSNVVVWFSRGFTCPFCRVYTDGVRAGYKALQAADTEVIQVAPNLLESARRYFGQSILPFPFVCDPDKRLYAVYGLGDRRALEATRTAVVSFAHAFTHGDSVNQGRGGPAGGSRRADPPRTRGAGGAPLRRAAADRVRR